MGWKHLAPNIRNSVYVGAGPRLSLDQKINFINENNCLAKRIIQVGNRQAFLSGLERNSTAMQKKSFYANGFPAVAKSSS